MGLEAVMESMYTAASLEPLSEDCGDSHTKNKKFKKHPRDKDKDEPKKEAAEATPCDHCGGTGKHDDGSACPECNGTGEIILGSEDALDDEQYGQPSLGDLALSDDQSELTATLIAADGKPHSIAINMTDPVKVKLRPGQGPGAGESVIQLGFSVEPEETVRVPPRSAPTASFPYPGQSKGLGSDRPEDKWTT